MTGEVSLIETTSAGSASDDVVATGGAGAAAGPAIVFQTSAGSQTHVDVETLALYVGLLQSLIVIWLAYREVKG